MSNPYKNRSLPVGVLKYPFPKQTDLSKLAAELEFGEREFLYHMPLLTNGGTYCNLGDGGSATIAALSMVHHDLSGKVYTVDSYDEKYRRRVAAEREALKVDHRIQLFHMRTDQAHVHLRGEQFSFLFIDASHEYNDVKSDVKLYLPMVKPGGFIGFHDTNQDDVDRVLREDILPKWNLVFWINRIKVFKLRA